MKINFLFRKPKFPFLLINGDEIYAVKSLKRLAIIIQTHDFTKNESYDIIDYDNEGWIYLPEYNMISPLTVKKSWRKKELVSLINSSKTLKDKNFEPLKPTVLNKSFKGEL